MPFAYLGDQEVYMFLRRIIQAGQVLGRLSTASCSKNEKIHGTTFLFHF